MGDRRRADRLRPLPRRLQHQRRPCARRSSKRVPLPQPSRDRRGLDLRQGPLRVHAPPRRGPPRRSRAAPGATRSRGRTRSTRPSGCCAARTGASSPRSPAPRRSSRRTRSASSCARGSTRTRRCCRRKSPARSTATGCRSRRSATPTSVVVLGDVPVVERAPVVDLWIKAAHRNGARLLDSADEVGDAERVVLIWSGAGRPRRCDRREARRGARPRRPRGVRRVLPPRDAERPRRRRRVGRVLRRRGGRAGVDRRARRLR